MKSDLQIAQEAPLRPITEVAAEIGVDEDLLELYGKYKAKIIARCAQGASPTARRGATST